MSDRDSYNEILLNGKPYKTRGPVPDTNLAVFPGKVTIGDYTQDSNPLLSSWVISDLSGGLGVDDMNEGVDVNRYRLGTLYTRYPNQISKPFAVTTFATSAVGHSAWAALGNIKDNATGAWDLIYLKGTANFEVHSLINGHLGNLTTSPVGPSVVFQGTSANTRVVIPMGDQGYGLASNAGALDNVADDATHPALQCAVVWDNKLIGMDVSGQLWWTTNPGGANTWSSYGSTAKLPSQVTTRSMTTYFDRQGQPAIYIVTDTDVWQFDPNGPELFTIDVSFPPHPYQGLAATKWGGDLYFSVGIGVHRYTGGSLSAVGLDRDQGLPIEYAGYIAMGGLVAGYNSLFAFVTMPDLSAFTFDLTTPSPMSAIYEFTGTGWHMIWESATETMIPNSMLVSRVDGDGDAFSLLWGTRDTGTTSTIYQLDLPIGFFNPRQRVRAEGGYASSSDMDLWLETPVFDAGMKGYNKLANAFDITINTIKAGSVLTVYYQRDSGIADGPDATWTELGIIGSTGTTSLPFGDLTALDGIYPGEVFKRIRFRFSLVDTSNDGFILESAVFSFVKLVPPSWSWTVELDLTTPHAGRSPEVMRDELDALLDPEQGGGVMVPLVLRGNTYRVFVAQLAGSVETGADESLFRRLSLLEVPGSLGLPQN